MNKIKTIVLYFVRKKNLEISFKNGLEHETTSFHPLLRPAYKIWLALLTEWFRNCGTCVANADFGISFSYFILFFFLFVHVNFVIIFNYFNFFRLFALLF